MKRLLLSCICLLSFMIGWSKAVNIEWHEPVCEEREIGRRSISIVPVAAYDEGTISIYFSIPNGVLSSYGERCCGRYCLYLCCGSTFKMSHL